jgi:hypothetical protein
MTTIVEADTAIVNHFIDEWGSLTPIALRNQHFSSSDEFVRIIVNSTASKLIGGRGGGFGDRDRRFFGLVIVQVFTKSNTGITRNNQLCQRALEILSQEIDGVEIKECYPKDAGDDGLGFYQQQVVAEYHYDYIG